MKPQSDEYCKNLCRYYGTEECPYKNSPWHCEKFKFIESRECWLWWDKKNITMEKK